ncbi:hypothetical protein B0H19DRAFT_438309 [Mycena capillaripes]|nr:hypothetical protein B0H19DRAFT_438309 [Mycena capillaripes]
MPQASLSVLPPELLFEILAFLDAKTLLLCSSVCNLWRKAVKSSPELQYTIELWADGMVHGDSGILTHTDTLEALFKLHCAWKTLAWTSKTVVKIESLAICRAYELVAGIFAQQQQGPDFLAVSLSSIVDDPKHARLTHDIGIDPQDFQDFAIDPTQDLMAFMYVPPGELAHLELRTMSSHEPHPLATHPHLLFTLDRDPTMSLSIQIVDDIIGMFFPEPLGVIIFNWRTGSLIVELVDPDLPLSVVDFHFLSPRSYILAHECDEVHEAGRIEIFTFDGDQANLPTLVVILELPELIPDVFITSMMIQAGPYCAQAISGTPFLKSNDNRIYMLLIFYKNIEWYRLFVHHRLFQQYILEHVRETKTEKMIVPWDDWGPQNTRMLPGQNHRWIRHVHGERVALPRQNPNSLELLDFGINPKRTDLTETPTSAGATTELHLTPSTLGKSDIFRNVVTTSLPYRSTLRALNEEFDLFLIDQDRIIGMNVSESGVLSHQMTVYTF